MTFELLPHVFLINLLLSHLLFLSALSHLQMMILTMGFDSHIEMLVTLLFLFVIRPFCSEESSISFHFCFVVPMPMAGCLRRIILLADFVVRFWVLGSIILLHFRNALISILS